MGPTLAPVRFSPTFPLPISTQPPARVAPAHAPTPSEWTRAACKVRTLELVCGPPCTLPLPFRLDWCGGWWGLGWGRPFGERLGCGNLTAYAGRPAAHITPGRGTPVCPLDALRSLFASGAALGCPGSAVGPPSLPRASESLKPLAAPFFRACPSQPRFPFLPPLPHPLTPQPCCTRARAPRRGT